MLLTQQGGLLKPIAWLLGKILNFLYIVSCNLSIESIGVSIIVFTVLIRLLLLPTLYKQNRSSKIMKYIQPEINKVNKKYKGKKDQDSILKQQQEVRAIQDKYGVSMTAGCLTSLIQLPIFIALYRVIQNIPAYVDKVKNLYSPIADAIVNDDKAVKALSTLKDSGDYAILKQVKFNVDGATADKVIDVLAKFPTEAWDNFKTLLGNSSSEVVNLINANQDKIDHANHFFSIDLTSTPVMAGGIAMLIPILSMVFQFLSMKTTPQQPATDPSQEQTMKTMKTMMYFFPIMSFFITLNVPTGLGLYWATGSFVSFVTSLLINTYFKHCDMEAVIEKSKEKAAKKIAERKAKGKKTFYERMMEAQEAQNGNTNSNNASVNRVASKSSAGSLKNYSSATMKTADTSVKYREGSLAAKANLMQKFNNASDDSQK